MKTLSLLAVCLLSLSTLTFAQTPAGKGRYDCSQAKDPKACEERREKIRAAHDKAAKACEAAKGAERRECMRREMCAGFYSSRIGTLPFAFGPVPAEAYDVYDITTSAMPPRD